LNWGIIYFTDFGLTKTGWHSFSLDRFCSFTLFTSKDNTAEMVIEGQQNVNFFGLAW
jgi:hypothetical protein